MANGQWQPQPFRRSAVKAGSREREALRGSRIGVRTPGGRWFSRPRAIGRPSSAVTDKLPKHHMPSSAAICTIAAIFGALARVPTC
jgi:hypothetical protein